MDSIIKTERQRKDTLVNVYPESSMKLIKYSKLKHKTMTCKFN